MRLVLSGLMVLAGALDAAALDRNVIVGWSVVGPAQYDQGQFKGMASANLSGFLRIGDSFSLGGVGAAVRASDGLDTLEELGLAVPFATFHLGRGVAQIGVEIQRSNLQKNFYYLGFGLSFGRDTRATRERATPEK